MKQFSQLLTQSQSENVPSKLVRLEGLLGLDHAVLETMSPDITFMKPPP